METIIAEHVYTLKETARILKVVQRTVYRRICAKEIEAYKEGRLWRVAGSAIIEYRQKSKARTVNTAA